MQKYHFQSAFFFAIILFNSSYKKIDINTSCEMHCKLMTINKYDSIIKPYVDTTAHLKNLYIKKKSKYINKPLNNLLDALDIQPMSYMVSSPDNNTNVSDAISLSFLNTDQTGRKMLYEEDNKPTIITIVWQTPIPIDSIIITSAKNDNKGEWTTNEKEFYGKQIVKDIILTDWTKPNK